MLNFNRYYKIEGTVTIFENIECLVYSCSIESRVPIPLNCFTVQLSPYIHLPTSRREWNGPASPHRQPGPPQDREGRPPGEQGQRARAPHPSTQRLQAHTHTSPDFVYRAIFWPTPDSRNKCEFRIRIPTASRYRYR